MCFRFPHVYQVRQTTGSVFGVLGELHVTYYTEVPYIMSESYPRFVSVRLSLSSPYGVPLLSVLAVLRSLSLFRFFFSCSHVRVL